MFSNFSELRNLERHAETRREHFHQLQVSSSMQKQNSRCFFPSRKSKQRWSFRQQKLKFLCENTAFLLQKWEKTPATCSCVLPSALIPCWSAVKVDPHRRWILIRLELSGRIRHTGIGLLNSGRMPIRLLCGSAFIVTPAGIDSCPQCFAAFPVP